MAKRRAWRDVTVPTVEGEHVLRVDFNSEKEVISIDPETGKSDVFSVYEAYLLTPDGKKKRIVIKPETLKDIMESKQG